jgi:hypothetical protein
MADGDQGHPCKGGMTLSSHSSPLSFSYSSSDSSLTFPTELILPVRHLWNQREGGSQWNLKELLVTSSSPVEPWQAKLNGCLTLKRSSTGFYLKAKLEGTLHSACDFCDAALSEAFTLSLKEIFVLNTMMGREELGIKSATTKRGKDLQLEAEDFYEQLSLDETLSLPAFLEEAITLQLDPAYDCLQASCIASRPHHQHQERYLS